MHFILMNEGKSLFNSAGKIQNRSSKKKHVHSISCVLQHLHEIVCLTQNCCFSFLLMINSDFSCPFDYVKLYDGYTNEDEVIGTYCGKLKNFDLYSTGEALHIEFVTKSGRVEPTDPPYVPYWETDTKIRRSGFKAMFTIRNDFVDLGKCVSGLTIFHDFLHLGENILGLAIFT